MAKLIIVNGRQLSARQLAIIETLQAGKKLAMFLYPNLPNKCFWYRSDGTCEAEVSNKTVRTLWRHGIILPVVQKQEQHHRVFWFALAPLFAEVTPC